MFPIPQSARLALIATLTLVPTLPILGQKAPTKNGEPKAPVAPVTSNPLLDELELLEAQLEVRKVMLKAAESRKKTTSDRLKLLEGIPGIARSELDLLRAEVERSTSDVEIRAAELKEHEVRIAITRRQASRTIPNTSKPEEKDPLRDLVEALAKAQLQRDQELQAEKKRLAEEKKAQEQARIDQQKQQQLIELESRRAAEKTELENRLRHLNTELDQLGSKIKLMETKIAQVELEKRALLVQSEEMMAHKTRLEALKKEIEQQLKREPR